MMLRIGCKIPRTARKWVRSRTLRSSYAARMCSSAVAGDAMNPAGAGSPARIAFPNASQTVPFASGNHLRAPCIYAIDYTARVKNAEFQRKIYSVSELSFEIREMLERRFIDVWVEGELSNYKTSTAGHIYFTLKDKAAQLPAVCFRNAARLLRFRPENGKVFRARGRVSTYEGRGEYQLIVEVLEPAGLGALQLAFEQLKEKLEKEGLFRP